MKIRRSFKNIAIFTVLSMVFAPILDSASASVKAGAPCTKKSATKTVGNIQFTCIVKNKKLVWDKGVNFSTLGIPTFTVKPTVPAQTAPTSTPTPTQTPTPTPTPKKYVVSNTAEAGDECADSTEIAFTSQGPIACVNRIWKVQRSNESVRAAAFSSILARWKMQPDFKTNLDVHKDSSAGDWTNEVEFGVNAGAKFWGIGASAQAVLPIFISDNPKYIEDTLLSAQIQQSSDAKSRNANALGSQMGFHSDSLNHVVYLDFMIPKKEQQFGAQAASGVHEYTHLSQYALSKNRWHSDGGLPWAIEGLASYVAAALAPMINGPHNAMFELDSALKTTQTDLAYWAVDKPDIYSSPNWHDIYSNGAIASEALIALVGVDAVVQMWTDLGKGSTFAETYKRNFGLEGTVLSGLLNDYIKSKKSGAEWTLQELRSKYAALR